MRRLASLVAVVALATSCSSGPGDGGTDMTTTETESPVTTEAAVVEDLARPETLAGLTEVTLLGPEPTDVGAVPRFSWDPVDGAAMYRLSVLGTAGPIWAWQGSDTTVWLGAVESEPSPGAGGVRLVEPGYWSVAAIDTTGAVLALSGLRTISPDSSTPSWVPGKTVEQTTTTTTVAADDQFSACTLLTDAELSDYLGTDPTPGVEETLADGQYYGCSWGHPDDSLLDVSIDIYTEEGHWEPTRWAGPDYEPIDGLGEDSFVLIDWVGSRVGFLHHGMTVYLITGYGSDAAEPTLDLARLIQTRLAAADLG